MNLIYLVVYFLLFIILLNIFWPLLVGLFLLMLVHYVYARIQNHKLMRQQLKQEAFYETIEQPQQDLDIIDVEYGEKNPHE